jgi:hypothetical protein
MTSYFVFLNNYHYDHETKGDELSGACSMNGAIRNGYQIFVEILKGVYNFWRSVERTSE